MKKFLLLLLIISTHFANAQIINRIYSDTTAANNEMVPGKSKLIKNTPGAQIFTTDLNCFWVRNAAKTAWIRVGAPEEPTIPTLDQVTTAGSVTSNNFTLSSSYPVFTVQNLSTGKFVSLSAPPFMSSGKIDIGTSYGTNYVASISPAVLSAGRNYSLPDKSGTFALTSDVPTIPLEYTAIITQTSTAAPSATVVANTTGGTIVWSRSIAGVYTAALSGGTFTANKTVIFITKTSGLSNILTDKPDVAATVTGTSSLLMASTLNGSYADGVIDHYSIRVLIYP